MSNDTAASEWRQGVFALAVREWDEKRKWPTIFESDHIAFLESDAGRAAVLALWGDADALTESRAEVERLNEQLAVCSGKPHSSRPSEQGHEHQIRSLQRAISGATVTFRCDCGMAMTGPFHQEDWRCVKCRTGKLIAEPIRERDALASQLEEAKAEIERLKADRDQWKSNHDNQVALRRELTDRPDLGDRAKSLQSLHANIDRLRSERDSLASEVAPLKERIAELESRLSLQGAASEVRKESGALGIAFCEFISEDYPAAIKLLRSLNDVTGLSLQGHAHVS